MAKQDTYFFRGEGDQWFLRNKDALGSARLDPPLYLVEQYGLRPKTVLEIGCSNGFRLDALNKQFGSQAVGVEPSLQAIADGRKKYKKVRFVRGVASKVPLKEQFDLVIVNYVLHWVSREEFFRALAEIDRLVRPGGHLIIGDFGPDYPTRKPYHHAKKGSMYTWKVDYERIFVNTALYRTVSRITFDHTTQKLQPFISGAERGTCMLLEKTPEGFFAVE